MTTTPAESRLLCITKTTVNLTLSSLDTHTSTHFTLNYVCRCFRGLPFPSLLSLLHPSIHPSICLPAVLLRFLPLLDNSVFLLNSLRPLSSLFQLVALWFFSVFFFCSLNFVHLSPFFFPSSLFPPLSFLPVIITFKKHPFSPHVLSRDNTQTNSD